MKFTEAIVSAFTNYVNFNGRARRSAYWYYMLFYGLCLWVVSILSLAPYGYIFSSIFYIVTLLPTISLCWRRLHDTGRSGAWYFISLVPLAGSVLFLVWMVEDSQPGENAYGPNPKTGWKAGNASSSVNSQGGGLAVRCLSGPMQGQTFPLSGREMRFGREGDCQVRFPDGTPGISRNHCCLRWSGGAPMLVDLGSQYGTFLGNGTQLPPNYPRPVSVGTTFYLGSRSCLFQIVVYRN